MKNSILLPAAAIGLAAVLLFGISLGLNGVAAQNAQAEQQRLMQTLLPGSTEFTAEPYTGDDANIRSVHKSEQGFVIETASRGYAGEVTMLVGVSSRGNVMGLVVREMSETFSLGANALTDREFLAQFLNGSGEFVVVSNSADAFTSATGSDAAQEPGGDGEVDAMTGATVTSRAIARCVNSAVSYVTGADIESGATSWGG